MGTVHGIPLAAADDRIAAAVFGLNALRPGDDEMAANAAAITIPILFLNQSDDELMTRDAALALWDALGHAETPMHLNPRGPAQVHRLESPSSEGFLRRHLLSQTTADAERVGSCRSAESRLGVEWDGKS